MHEWMTQYEDVSPWRPSLAQQVFALEDFSIDNARMS